MRQDGARKLESYQRLRCNWLQVMENSVDPSHLFWLHGETAHLVSYMPEYREGHEFRIFEYGIWKRRITPGKNPGDPPQIDEHPLVFPTILRQREGLYGCLPRI